MVAFRAEIIRIVDPSARSQNTTRRIRPLVECPIRMKRSSSELCSGSKNSTDSESAQMVWASSNQTPCFLKLDRFLFSSHSNRIFQLYSIVYTTVNSNGRTKKGSWIKAVGRTVPRSRVRGDRGGELAPQRDRNSGHHRSGAQDLPRLLFVLMAKAFFFESQRKISVFCLDGQQSGSPFSHSPDTSRSSVLLRFSIFTPYR